MSIVFPDSPANNDFYSFQTSDGQYRVWKYITTFSSWKSRKLETKTYTRYGSVASNTGVIPWDFNQNVVITSISAGVLSPPVGNSINITVKKSGSAVANLTIGSGSYAANTVLYYSNLASFTMTANDYLTVDTISTAGLKANTLSVVFTYIAN